MKKIIILVLFMNALLMANYTRHPSIPLIINNSIKVDIHIEFEHNKFIKISKFIINNILFPKNIFIYKNKSALDNYIIEEAKGHLGEKYVWGATGPSRFDCSGFTSYVYKKMGITIPRVSKNQGKVGKKVRRSRLKKGDLVFFDTSRRRRGYINHVGIYIGNHKFIHASSSKRKVIISSLNKRFYKARFKWGRRLK